MSVRIGEMLVQERLITPRQLEQAVRQQRDAGGTVGPILVELGYVKDEEITALLSRHYRVPSIDLTRIEIDREVKQVIPAETARKYKVLPVKRAGITLTIAMTDPTDVFAMDDIKFMTGYHLEVVLATEPALMAALDTYYPMSVDPEGASSLERATRALAELPQLRKDHVEMVKDTQELDIVTLEQQGGETPVVRMVNVLLVSAIHRGASDIHVEPYERDFRVRFRIDGVLHHVMVPPLKLKDALTSRIKVMAKLDIAEKRLPQDGRIKLRFRDRGATREIDLRVSCLPTLFGEKIVLRLLDRSKLMLDMGNLGFEPESLRRFEEGIRRPWGMVLVTGPTGSGKTNTLYSSIARINSPERNIMTVEDPVEFNLDGVNQVQVREAIGLTFGAVLRSFLRQDPNIILVGEIRDLDTAEVAVKAALTGHLVLSTLHTNDAPSTVSRLINMGIEPFLVAGSVNVVCAQRLVRRLCTCCARPIPMSPEGLLRIGFSENDSREVVPRDAQGCPNCNYTGYQGRLGLFEVMELTDGLHEMIVGRASTQELRRQATASGMLSLRQSGLRKVRDGLTTVEEVIRESAA